MASASVDIRNLLLALQQHRAKAIAAATSAVVLESERILGEAQQICPVSPSNKKIPGQRKKWIKNPAWTGHSGDLANSATADEPVNENCLLTRRIGFTAVYAAVQHERLDYRHTQGRAKYLETAIQANVDHFRQRIIAAVRGAIGG